MTVTHRPLQAKLIYNATAGPQGDSPQQLESILAEKEKTNERVIAFN